MLRTKGMLTDAEIIEMYFAVIGLCYVQMALNGFNTAIRLPSLSNTYYTKTRISRVPLGVATVAT